MDLIYKITGGIYPGEYRSTAVKVINAETVGEGSKIVSNWCNANFDDANHIDVVHNARFHVATLNAYRIIPVYFGRKY
jgi:hypothetical protein